jgi:hypothetical protein
MKTKAVTIEGEFDLPNWTWEKRLTLDEITHKEVCTLCRGGKVKLGPRDFLYGVKNKATREYRHMVARSAEEALIELGWTGQDVWIMIVDSGTKGPMMTEETKQKLRAYNAKKRAERGTYTPIKKQSNARTRHYHHCPVCDQNYAHVATIDCPDQIRTCIMCEVVDEKSNGGIDSSAAVCYTDVDSMSRDEVDIEQETLDQKGGDIMDIKTFVKEFIDGQCTEEDEKTKKPVLSGDKLFALAKANGVEAGKYRKEFNTAAGRIRMTIGNMIRGAAVRNGKLITIGGATKTVPEALLPKKKEKVEKKAKEEKKASAKKAA